MAWSMPNPGMAWNPSMVPTQPFVPDPSSMGNYTPDQWAAVQQQNWQQWSQWQQQYATWQQQYGEKYAQQMQAIQTMGGAPMGPMVGMPPLPTGNQAAPPAPPPPDKPPPPPPHENDQPLFGNATSQNSQNNQHPIQPYPDHKGSVSDNNSSWSNNKTQSENNINNANINSEALKKLAEEERLFDIQFQKWEEEIEKWKADNVNHPDKQAYKDYEDKFESCRAQLLERRKQMNLKRDKLLGVPSVSSAVVSNTPATAITQNITQTENRVQPQHKNNINVNTSGQNYSKQQQYTRTNQQIQSQNYDEDSHSQDMLYANPGSNYSNTSDRNMDPQDRYDAYDDYSNSNFLNTSASQGIPGLDLVPDKPPQQPAEVIDITDEKQGPDYTNITKGINSILGDEKIMNILSMVRSSTGQNQPLQPIQQQSNPSNALYNATNFNLPPQNNTWDGKNKMSNKQSDNSQQNIYNQNNAPNLMSRPNDTNQNQQLYQQPPPQQRVFDQGYQNNNRSQQDNRSYQNNQGFQGSNQSNNTRFQGNNQGLRGNNQGLQGNNQGYQGNNQGLQGNNQSLQGNNQSYSNTPQNQYNYNNAPPYNQQQFNQNPNFGDRGNNANVIPPNMSQNHMQNDYQGNRANYPPPQPQPVVEPMKPPAPKWVEVPMFTPSIVVEYDHRPLRDKTREFIEPVHTFDYDHKSKETDKTKDIEREVDEELFFTKSKDRRSPIYDRYEREREPYGRDRESYGREREPYGREREPYGREREPYGREREVYGRDRQIYGRDREPYARERDTYGRDRDHYTKDKEPYRRELPRDSFADHRSKEYGSSSFDDIGRSSDDRKRDDRSRFSRREVSRDRERDSYRDKPRDHRRDDFHDSRDRDTRKRAMSVESESSKSSSKEKNSFAPNASGFPDKNRHIVMIDDLLEPPGREVRPSKIVIILRGPPGSGKSYLAKLIRDREAELGGAARIMSIDDYFVQEHEIEETDPVTGKIVKKPSLKYEYDESSEEVYFNSLKRAFKRSLTDGYFNFLIMDAVNDQLKSYADIWNFARQSGFQVYICTMELNPQICHKRNIHNRTLSDIEVICARFFPTPKHHIQLDATTLLQNAAIEDVHMEDVSDDVEIIEDAQDNEVENVITSKWEKMDDANQLARLDGTSKPLRSSNITMEDYLQLDEWTPTKAKPGKKTVRWADIEERREQEKMRAIGFVVGQTDWNRMTDPTMGSSALTQTKYIERVRRNNY